MALEGSGLLVRMEEPATVVGKIVDGGNVHGGVDGNQLKILNLI